MAQTILTPQGEAENVSTLPNPFEDLIPQSSSIPFDNISLELTDEQKALPNPFDDIPKANTKNSAQTAYTAAELGRRSVLNDFKWDALQKRNLYEGVPPTKEELSELKKEQNQLEIEAFYNRGDNLATDIAYKAVEMVPPMVGGTLSGLESGAKYGLGGAALGATMGPVALPAAAMGGKLGFSFGFAKGSYDYWRRQGSGASYRELLENEVDPNIAAQVAELVGPAYSAVEYSQVGKLIDVAAGKQIKSALLRGAIKGVSKFLPKGIGETAEKLGKSSVVRGAGFVLEEAAEEGVQEGITAGGTIIGEATTQAIKEDATAGALDVISQLELGDAGEVLGRSLQAFKESIGPLAVLGGSAKLTGIGVKKTGQIIKNIATGEIDTLSELRSKVAAAGAPATAEAMAGIEVTTPGLNPQEAKTLEADLDASATPRTSQPDTTAKKPEATDSMRVVLRDMGYPDSKIDTFTKQEAYDIISGGEDAIMPTEAQPPTEESSVLDAQNSLEAAKVFSKIRARKPVSAQEIKQYGFMLPSGWKLNEETQNFEYEGTTIEPKKEEQNQEPISQTPALVSAEMQPQAPKESEPAVVATLSPAEKKAQGWLEEVNRAKNKRERSDLISIFRDKIDSLSETERQAAKIFDSLIIRQNEAKPKTEAPPTAPTPVAPTTKTSGEQPVKAVEKKATSPELAAQKAIKASKISGDILGINRANQGVQQSREVAHNAKRKASSPETPITKAVQVWEAAGEETTYDEPEFVSEKLDFAISGGYDKTKNQVKLTTDPTEFSNLSGDKPITPRSTVLHELGHWALFNKAGKDLIKRLFEWADSTDRAKILDPWYGGKAGFAYPKDKFNKRDELIADAYAIWKLGGAVPTEVVPMLEELDALIPQTLKDKGLQFADTHASKISKAESTPAPKAELSKPTRDIGETQIDFSGGETSVPPSETTATSDLPKFEEVVKKNKQLRYLRKIFKLANQKLPEDRRVVEKNGWKAQDYFKNLENIYGQINQLEFAKPEAKPQETKPAELSSSEKRRGRKLQRLAKVFSNQDLNADQTYFRDVALGLARKIAKQVGAEFPNLKDAADEIYGRLVDRIAGRIFASVAQNKPVLFDESGKATELDEESISKYVLFSARRAALDALKVQKARAEVALEFGPSSAEGAVTQPEAAKEESKPTGLQVKESKEEPVLEPRAVAALREAANLIREQSGPEVKLVIDWIVDSMIGADTELAKLKTYKDLAAYLSKVANRKVSDKRVGEFVAKVVEQISENLKDENIKAKAEDLMMLLTPEGKAARERQANEEAQRKQDREIKEAISVLSDRIRNLDGIGYGAKQALIDALSSSNTSTRARITAEIIVPLEQGLIEETEVATRQDNIKKGIENEKPRTRQTIPRGKPAEPQQTQEGQIPSGTGQSVESQPRGASTSPATEGRTRDADGGTTPVSTPTSENRPQVGQKQPATPGDVSVDPKLTQSKSRAVKVFVQTATSSGYPATYVVDPNLKTAVGTSLEDVEGNSEYPVIRVNPKLLQEAARNTGTKFPAYAFMSINEEVTHFKYLRLLKSEAAELKISFRQHLKNETKRIAKIIKRRRGLKKKIEAIYNQGQPFTGESADFQLVFEYMRMLTQGKIFGTITEAVHTDLDEVVRSLELQDRRFIFRFFDAIRNFLYGVTGRTAAETRFLRETADAVARMSQRITRDLGKPNEVKPVLMNYHPPKEDTLLKKTKRKKGELEEAREELKKDSGLSRNSVSFLKDYARELGIKVPTMKRKVIVFNETTRKYEEKTFRVPFWKKAQYVEAIKAKLKTLGKDPKQDSDEQDTILGAALPSDQPFWLKPDGEMVDVEESALIDMLSVGSHTQAAIEWLNENDSKNAFLAEWKLLDPLERKERQQLPIAEMIGRGWLRVVGDGFNLFFEGSPNQEQLDKLFETSINDEVKLIQDLSGLSGRPRSKILYEPPLEDELGAAMPRHGFSTTEPKFSGDWEELPDSLEGLAEIDTRPGSFDVRVYSNAEGRKFIVKRGQSLEQFENEIAAERIYRLLNYPVAESKLITLPDGKPAKIAEFIYGPTLGQFEKEISPVDPETVSRLYKEIGNGLLIDAFLFNYDVLGEDLDNIIVAQEDTFEQDVVVAGEPIIKTHTAYRVDNGGTFDLRARGLPKNPFFYDTFAELQKKYPRFELNASDLVAQLSDIVLNSDEILNSVPERLQPLMAQRLQWMVDQLSAIDTLPPVAGTKDSDVMGHFQNLAKSMEQVKVVRDSGGNLVNEETGLPSEMRILDSTGKVVRTYPKSEFRYRLERTPQFKMWYGEWENLPATSSRRRLLDQSGEPLTYYHGTNAVTRIYANFYKEDPETANYRNPFWPTRAFSTGNTFRGVWVSSSRQFAEKFSLATADNEYEEQIVIPVYVKSTNPFDAKNPEHIQKLIAYAKGKGKAFSLRKINRLALENGHTDWKRFEAVDEDYSFPDPTTMEDLELSEPQRKAKYFADSRYTTLEAIINLGFDSLIATEVYDEKTSESNAVNEALYELASAQAIKDVVAERKATETLKAGIEKYNQKAVENVLVWRPDGLKSIMNSGKFKSLDRESLVNLAPQVANMAARVKRNGTTLWNEFERNGITFASYESPEQLVTYSYMTASQLSKNNIAKDFLKENLVYVGKRIVPGARSARDRVPSDILGSAMPRRFGVRIKDKVTKEAYDRLEKLNYEPIPDAMTEGEADAYLAKNGLRGSMEAALSTSSPLQHGSRELLAQKIILGLNAKYEDTKDPRILDDLIIFIDKFLEQSSGIGRALRALSFWSNLTPEGMIMLYKKKSDEVNLELRDKFNVFFDKVKRELSVLPEGTIDEALKKMSSLLGKAQNAADESKKKLAEKNTMTFWEAFSNQMGEGIVSKAAKELEDAEAAAAVAQGVPVESMTPEMRKAVKRLENAQSINQAAQEMSREIKKMFMDLAKEQGRRIRDPRINTEEEFAKLTIEEQEKVHKEEREAAERQKFASMLKRWPKALQAWTQASEAIRKRTANNPELSEMFNGFLGLVLETPFTMPQLAKYISLRGVKLEDLIRTHYEEGKLANNAFSLAKEIVDEAGLGAWEEEIGSDAKDEQGFLKFSKRDESLKKEDPSKTEKMPSLSERLTTAIALQIQEIVAKETEKKLNRLIKAYADKALEPSLYRFAKRFTEYQSLGLFQNAAAWTEFQRQEGLDKLKPEVVSKITNIMVEAEKLVGFRKDEKIADALSLISYETQRNGSNFAKSWWYLSILSGFGTQVANALGNLSNTLLLALPTMGRHMVQGVDNPSTSKALLGRMFNALTLSLRDAGNLLYSGRVGTRKSDPKFFGKAATDYFEVIARNSVGSKTLGIDDRMLATSASVIRRVMTAVDMIFYNFNKEVYLYEASYNEAIKSGLRGEAATKKALAQVFRNSESLAAAKAQAIAQGYVVDAQGVGERLVQEAEQAIRIQEIIDANTEKDQPELAAIGQITGTQATFNEEPSGVLGSFHRMIGAFAKEHPLKSAVFVPFTRIVANVWNQSIDATGLGMLRSAGLPPIFGPKLAGKFAMEFKGTAEEIRIQKQLTFARGATGLTVVILLGLLDQFLCGNYEKYGVELCINGSGPKDAAQKELLKNRLNWKPNSLLLKINHIPLFKEGLAFSYMYTPLAMGLSAIGLLNDNETYNYFDKKSPVDVSIAMAHRIATIMFDMNFLSGASDLFEMLNPSNPEAALAKAKSFVSRLGSTMIVPNLVRDIDQLLLSPMFGYPGRTAREGLFQGALIANTPIVRHIYNKPELDMLGKPIEMQFRPISMAKKDALVQALVEKNALPSAPKKESFFGVVKMNDSQYADYRLERAKQLGAMLGGEGVLEMIQNSTPGIAQLYVSKLTERANQMAKAKLIQNEPQILQEVSKEKSEQFK